MGFPKVSYIIAPGGVLLPFGASSYFFSLKFIVIISRPLRSSPQRALRKAIFLFNSATGGIEEKDSGLQQTFRVRNSFAPVALSVFIESASPDSLKRLFFSAISAISSEAGVR